MGRTLQRHIAQPPRMERNATHIRESRRHGAWLARPSRNLEFSPARVQPFLDRSIFYGMHGFPKDSVTLWPVTRKSFEVDPFDEIENRRIGLFGRVYSCRDAYNITQCIWRYCSRLTQVPVLHGLRSRFPGCPPARWEAAVRKALHSPPSTVTPLTLKGDLIRLMFCSLRLVGNSQSHVLSHSVRIELIGDHDARRFCRLSRSLRMSRHVESRSFRLCTRTSRTKRS